MFWFRPFAFMGLVFRKTPNKQYRLCRALHQLFFCARFICGLRCEIFGHGNNDGKSNFYTIDETTRFYCLLLHKYKYIVYVCNVYALDNVLNVSILGERFNLIAYIMGRIASTYVTLAKHIRLQMLTEQKMLLNLFVHWVVAAAKRDIKQLLVSKVM